MSEIVHASFTLTIRIGTAPEITSPVTTTLTRGQAAGFTVTTTGDPVPGLRVSGTLPPGVVFTDHGDGTAGLSGTPTGQGAWIVTVTGDDHAGTIVTQRLTILVT